MGGPEEETQDVVEARRLGNPYLVYADGHGRQQVLSLRDDWSEITIGGGWGPT